MITTNAHRVEKVELSAVRLLADTTWTRKFRFISDGNLVELTLFAQDPDDLMVVQS